MQTSTTYLKKYSFLFVALVSFCAIFSPAPTAVAVAQSGTSSTSHGPEDAALEPGGAALILPQDLVGIPQTSKDGKPLILNVGPSLLYMQVHIPGAEFVGAASSPQGMESLRRRVKPLPRDQFIVLYCGCCPWSHCPNVRPAYQELRKEGFTKVKVLYIADNFGADWVDKGYPTVKGQ